MNEYKIDMDKATFEMCSCGHFGGSSMDIVNSHKPNFQKGHGECIDCECNKFTWVGFCDKHGDVIK